jgi:predicted  nucleic acid-binding Zn-ribbon protein
MIKNLVSPIQAWLLSQKRCVGCGAALSKGDRKLIRNNMTVTCRCGRIFIYDEDKKTYRRALFDEV